MRRCGKQLALGLKGVIQIKKRILVVIEDIAVCRALQERMQNELTQLCDHYETEFGTNGMQNIVMMYKRDIGNKIYQQMMRHFYCENGFLQEEVVGTRNYNMQQSYQFKEKVGLYEDFTEDIRSVLFTGIKRGVFTTAKFDSKEGELTLARVLESDDDVLN